MRTIACLLLVGLLSACSSVGYVDSRGKFHDHDVAVVATHCDCGPTCDRATRCCGPEHCVCHPN